MVSLQMATLKVILQISSKLYCVNMSKLSSKALLESYKNGAI